MTPREAFGLLNQLSIYQIRERAEKLSLAGADGQKYLDEAMIDFEVVDEDNLAKEEAEFAEYSKTVMNAIFPNMKEKNGDSK